MDGVPAEYLGRFVSKENFRVFIYAASGEKKLVESWDDYQAHMSSGVWFAECLAPCAIVQEEKPKRVRKPVKPRGQEEPIEQEAKAEEFAVEVVDDEPLIEEEFIPVEPEVVNVDKDDDFLPKARK